MPRAQLVQDLEACGRMKEIEFTNNSTSEHIAELLAETFRTHLNGFDVKRLQCYKTVANTTVLTLVGEVEQMCGSTLRYRYAGPRMKVFLSMPRQGGMVVPNDDDVNNAQGSNPNDRERGGQASGSRRSVSEIILSEDEEEGNNIIPDTESVHGFTPDAVSNASGNSRRTSTPLRQQRVGVIEELDDVLLAAEIDPDSGPGHDVRILEHFMAVHKVPQRLIFISLSGEQMKMQCHTDATPVFLLRFQLTDGAVKVLRNLMESEECIAVLQHCNVHVSVMGSQFDLQACGTQLSTEKNQDVEIRILHPTFSSAKTLVGEILTGMEREFTKELCRAVSEARQAAHAVLAHRELIRKDRVIREEQDRQLRLSEEADRAKRLGARSGVSVEEDSREDDAEDTLPDLDEGSHSKRPRVSDTGNELDDSGTVTFRTR